MDSEIKTYVIRHYNTLGTATGKDEQDAIEAFLGREENKNLKISLVAEECLKIDWENNGSTKS